MKEEKKTKFQTVTGNVYFRLGLTVFILYLLTYYWSRMEKVLVMFGNAMVPLHCGRNNRLCGEYSHGIL